MRRAGVRALIGGAALAAVSATAAQADLVVVNSPSVVKADELSLEVYKNDGCLISLDFRRSNRSDSFFQCEGEWNWDEIRKTTRYYRDRVNIDREVNYFDVVEQLPNSCKKVDFNPRAGC